MINNSWGDCDTALHLWFNDSVTAWRAAGIVPIFSSGNTSNCGYTQAFCGSGGNPGRYSGVISVGATDSNDNIGNFSLWGPTDDPTSADGIKPDLSAPGVNIRSAISSGDASYYAADGTSMAAPHVAGVVALLLSANQSLIGQVDQIEQILEQSALPRALATACGNEGVGNVPNNAFGKGSVDAYAAALAAHNSDLGWLSASKLVGAIPAGQQETIALSFDAQLRTDGEFSAQLSIHLRDSGGDETISAPVTFVIGAPTPSPTSTLVPTETATATVTATATQTKTATATSTTADMPSPTSTLTASASPTPRMTPSSTPMPRRPISAMPPNWSVYLPMLER
ncbi:MAG: S8 family serine peptidase [Caldilineaceae bacterium]|nr:S8 family serine peptidase [Caldilineaceae bacterium]